MFVNHSTVLTEKNPTRCNSVPNFSIPYFEWSSTCFGRHTAHYQEPKTTQAASGFAYLEGCRTCCCWTLSGNVYATWQRPSQVAYTLPDNVQQPSTYAKLEAACAVLGSWWWAVCRPKHVEFDVKQGIIKFWYIVASCWGFLCRNWTFYYVRYEDNAVWNMTPTVSKLLCK
jgi:hypothetical protein